MVGGGLAGSEAAWALAERGIAVTLHEMRPAKMTAAHQTDRLAELVCSNSFKSVELTNAHGLLKAEMRRLGSVVLDAADQARVPGGAALAVDRVAFAQGVHDRITGHPGITLARGEVTELASPGIVATGPLTSEALATAIARKLDASSLAFFDAIAPIVSADSLDTTRLFRASRYGKGSRSTTRWSRRSAPASSTSRITSSTGRPTSRAASPWKRWRRGAGTCCGSDR